MIAVPHPATQYAAGRPEPQAGELTPLLRASFYCFCLFNVAVYSRFFEWKLVFLHVPLITGSIALMGAALEGRLIATLRSKIGMCMTALTAIYAINVPLSTWRGESFQVFTQEWLKSFIAFAIAGALVVTFRQCRSALTSIGWGAGIASLLANMTGQAQTHGGRLAVGSGTLGNANEVAFILLLGLPFMWLAVTDKHGNKLIRLLELGMTVSMVYALLRTGSRAGFIGLCLLCLMLFLRASIFGKVAIAMTALVVGVWVAGAFPKVMERYKTIFFGSEVIAEAQTAQEAIDIDSAVESSQTRRKLLMNSLKVTAAHPLTGVGIGAFGSYMAASEREKGMIPHYQGTHNTYTQVSSEAGIPALLCFLGIIVFSFQGLRRAYKRGKRSPVRAGRDVANLCYALIASLTVYAVCVFFDYVAYETTLPVLAGFSIAVVTAAGHYLDVAERAPEALEPQPALIPLRPFPARRMV